MWKISIFASDCKLSLSYKFRKTKNWLNHPIFSLQGTTKPQGATKGTTQ